MTCLNQKGFPFVLNDCGVCMNPDKEVLYEGKPTWKVYYRISFAYYNGSWKYGYSYDYGTGGGSCGAWIGDFATKELARKAIIAIALAEVKTWKNGKKIVAKIAALTNQHTLF